jgi:Zn-finger nucleic acid-binding protein
MRILVACPQCQRQYDASGRAPGETFTCRCGAAVTIEQPDGHDASMVRCSSCGASRQQGAGTCGHCGGDFTIHEQDLDTVCPKCLARVSDSARYCHHCAALLVADPIVGAETALGCPACGDAALLTTRQLRDSRLAAMECQLCGGFWMGSETFARLLDREVRQPIRAMPAKAPPPLPGKMSYRPCAICKSLMVRWNFGRSSGVLVDVCRQHGIWFDAQELSHVLRWIRSGNLDAAQGDLARLRKSTLKRQPAASGPLAGSRGSLANDQPGESIVDDLLISGLTAIATAINRLFEVR